MSVTELHYGLRGLAGGNSRLKRLDRSLSDLDIVQTEEHLIRSCANLRAWAHGAVHPLAQKIHEADRWVAATAMELDLDLIAGDGIFEGVPDLARTRRPALSTAQPPVTQIDDSERWPAMRL